MNKKATLYIIQGFIGAGKSTFSRCLSKESDAIHLNPDEWVSKLYTQEEYKNDWNKCFEATVHKLWIKTKEYLSNGIDVIFDMGFWLKRDRDFARQIAQQCNADCKHYYLYVPDEILKERIVENRPPEWAKIHLENFDKNKKLFEIPSSDEDVVVINNFDTKNFEE